ncbi:MAG TPA: LPS assembly lipoprotein LptE [Burkholderiales bacterium]|nr:LPS assembly lipoprotein LptE [Burkholderiales bacterium]
MKRILRSFVALLLVGSLTACGFHLRGQQKLPFESLAVASTTPLAIEIKRAVTSGTETRVQDETPGAEAVLHILREAREKVILSLSSEGRVREYQLRYLVNFRVSRTQGGDYLPTNSIVLTRDMTYNEQVLSKEQEEDLLYREMRTDFVQQLMRRMAASKPILVN